MLPADTESHINLLLEGGEPFAVFIFPNESRIHILKKGDSAEKFEVVPWLGTYADRISLYANLCNSRKMPVEKVSTGYGDYITGVEAVIDSCRKRNGKTVYSRVICDSLGLEEYVDWGKTAVDLFNSYSQTFRFLYYTPETGAWLGATPELLLDFDCVSGDFSTVALAGTRLAGSLTEWDEKNICENRYVSDYILAELDQLGIKATISPMETVTYGKIEHLCARISGTAQPDDVFRILDAISPTPALCGWPKADAISDIERCERHSRGCYGGYILVTAGSRWRAYVNLRCVHFDRMSYCLFGGGGITPLSVSEEEFEETSNKTVQLASLIENNRKGKQ